MRYGKIECCYYDEKEDEMDAVEKHKIKGKTKNEK
jgi:hypothetical protein